MSKKIWKIAENRHVSTESNSQISRILNGYQPNIQAFCAPVIISCYPLEIFVMVMLETGWILTGWVCSAHFLKAVSFRELSKTWRWRWPKQQAEQLQLKLVLRFSGQKTLRALGEVFRPKLDFLGRCGEHQKTWKVKFMSSDCAVYIWYRQKSGI